MLSLVSPPLTFPKVKYIFLLVESIVYSALGATSNTPSIVMFCTCTVFLVAFRLKNVVSLSPDMNCLTPGLLKDIIPEPCLNAPLFVKLPFVIFSD